MGFSAPGLKWKLEEKLPPHVNWTMFINDLVAGRRAWACLVVDQQNQHTFKSVSFRGGKSVYDQRL